MALAGQHDISGSGAERAIQRGEPDGSIVRLYNRGSNLMHVADDDAVDSNSGYRLDPGESEAIRLDDSLNGGERALYVNGTSGDTLHWIVIS